MPLPMDASERRLRHKPGFNRLVLDRYQSLAKHRAEKAREFNMTPENLSRVLAIMGAALIVGGASVAPDSSSAGHNAPEASTLD